MSRDAVGANSVYPSVTPAFESSRPAVRGTVGPERSTMKPGSRREAGESAQVHAGAASPPRWIRSAPLVSSGWLLAQFWYENGSSSAHRQPSSGSFEPTGCSPPIQGPSPCDQNFPSPPTIE